MVLLSNSKANPRALLLTSRLRIKEWIERYVIQKRNQNNEQEY